MEMQVCLQQKYKNQSKNGRVNILGCPIDALTRQETVDCIEQHLSQINPKPWQHVAINAAKLVAMKDDPFLAETVKKCDMISADGQAVVWASRFLKQPLPERVAGIDLMEDLLRLCAAKGFRVFFLGAKDEVLNKVVIHYKQHLPSLQIVGFRNGYWSPEEEPAVVEQVCTSGAHILFVAISTPKKETFLARYLNELGVPFTMGVGGSFDVIAGYVRRAPRIWQKLGMEWLYRLLQEPRRMWRRYLIGNTRFLFMLSVALFKSPRKGAL